MIPIVTTVQQGNCIGTAKITKNGMDVKFKNATPQFEATFLNMVDSFFWSKNAKNNLEPFKIDTFEKKGK